MNEPQKTVVESTTLSTSDTLLQELDWAIRAASMCQQWADEYREKAEKIRREIETRDQMRLPLGDD